MDDPRFQANSDRVRNREELEPILDALFIKRDADEWLEKFRAARIPCGAVNSLPEILADEHFLARNGLVEMDHPTAGMIQMLSNPIHFSETPPVYDLHPPLMGEHTEEILRELGYSEEETGEISSRV